MNAHWEKLQELALAEIEATLAALPKPLREQAEKLPVTFERVPNAGLQADGIEADTLGLFTGSEFADEGKVPAAADHFVPGKPLGFCRRR